MVKPGGPGCDSETLCELQAVNLYWHRIWDHAKNVALKQMRQNPDVLYPGYPEL